MAPASSSMQPRRRYIRTPNPSQAPPLRNLAIHPRAVHMFQSGIPSPQVDTELSYEMRF